MASKKKRVWKTQTSTSHIVSVRIPLDLYARLMSYCAQEELSVTSVVCSTLSDYLDLEDSRQTMLEGGAGFIF